MCYTKAASIRSTARLSIIRFLHFSRQWYLFHHLPQIAIFALACLAPQQPSEHFDITIHHERNQLR